MKMYVINLNDTLPMIVVTALLHYNDCNVTKQFQQINNE